MLIRPAPGALVWPAAMVVWGPGFSSTEHSHHSVQLVMTMRGSLRVRGPGRPWRECGAVLVRPDAPHEVVALGETVVIAFVEPESELGAALCDRIARDIVCVSQGVVARWRAALGTPPTAESVERWVSRQLLRRRRPVAVDRRVAEVLALVRRQLGAQQDLSLKALAARAGVSPSRLMHLFTQSLGVPLRPYILWLRLQRAACELMAGATVTKAAHRAGFADAAHLTRTFRRMLGVTPSDMALRKRASRGLSVETPPRRIERTPPDGPPDHELTRA
jgi:AraC-like DNA-binding protein